MADKTAAALHGSGDCKKGCCWTPYKCARDWTCDHHREDAHKEARRDWTEQSALEIERAVQLASKRESARMEAWKQWR